MRSFVCLATFLFACCAFTRVDSTDRFHVSISEADPQKAEQEIQDFLSYGCETLVSIKNEAQVQVGLRCTSPDGAMKTSRLSPGKSHIFSFRPLANGSSVYWCLLAYRQYWVRFDVYSEKGDPYLCPGKKVYRYFVKDDGVYANVTKSRAEKIRALNDGHNKFTLWENYDDVSNVTDGLLMVGYVDGGMCADLPYPFDDKAKAITVCDHQCVYAYDQRGCYGSFQKLKASDGCKEFKIGEHLAGKTSSVKGC